MSKINYYSKPGRQGKRYRKQIGRRRYEKYFYGNKLQREADYKKWVEKLILDNKERRFDNSKTWNFFVSAYLKYIRTARDLKTGKLLFRARTVKEYEYALEHFRTEENPHYLQDLTFEKVAEFRRARREKAVANQEDFYGVNKDMGCLVRALKWGMAEGFVPYIDLGPVAEPLPTSEVQVSSLATWQLRLLLKYSSPCWRVACLMGFEGGLRPEEVYNFIIDKLDPKTGIAWVSHNDEDKKRGIHDWTPKRGKERPVFFSPSTVKAILDLHSKTYVVLSDEGCVLNDSTFSKGWRKNLDAVNDMILRQEPDTPPIDCTYKIFRKTHATYMMQAGASEKDASLYVAHSDPKTTKKHYIDKETLQETKKQERLAHMEHMKEYVLKLQKMVQK